MKDVESTEGRQRDPGGVAPPSTDVIGRMRANLEEFGLTGYQARVLITLLRAGSVNATELAELIGIHRTSVYPVLKELRALGLAQQISVKQGLWASPGKEGVIGWLQAQQEERSKALQARTEETAATLATHFGDTLAPPVPYVQLLSTDEQAVRAYHRCLAEVTGELLVFNCGPWNNAHSTPDPAVLEALDRGVVARALYREDEVSDPSLGNWHGEIAGYHSVGVEGRVVENVPMSLAIFDRRRVLFGLRPEAPERPDQIDVFVDHTAYAAAMVFTFESLWASGRPYVPEAADMSDDGPVREVIGRRALPRRTRSGSGPAPDIELEPEGPSRANGEGRPRANTSASMGDR